MDEFKTDEAAEMPQSSQRRRDGRAPPPSHLRIGLTEQCVEPRKCAYLAQGRDQSVFSEEEYSRSSAPISCPSLAIATSADRTPALFARRP